MIKVDITAEQFEYAKSLVEYSMTHHKVRNIWGDDNYEATFKNRLCGTLGEVVFADYYCAPRPSRSFGAIDGQDNGQDFKFASDIIIDLKTQLRKNPENIKSEYVLNIPAYQLNKPDSLTTHYFCINIDYGWNTAVLIGYVPKAKIRQVSPLIKEGTERYRNDGTSFIIKNDTYELAMGDLDAAPFWQDKGEFVRMY